MKSKILCFGELLLRLSPPNHLRLAQATNFDLSFTGSEANVAVALAQMGLPAHFVSRLPDNEVGHLGLSFLKKYDVQTEHVVFGGDRLGLFYLEMGIGQRASRVLYDRAYSSLATIEKGQIDWQSVLKNCTWFHWSGITPAISQAAADATLEALQVAISLDITVSCDLNHRASLWQYGKHPSVVMPELVQHTHVLLGDGDTIASYFGIECADYALLAEKTLAAFPNLTHLALSARKAFHASHNSYQGFLYDRKNFYASREYDIVDILDRLGTGDAFMAGLIYGLHQQNTPPQYVVEFAAASAVLNHTVYGDFNLVRVDEVEALMHGSTGGKVIR